MDFVLLIVRLVLAGLFGVAALGKLADPKGSRKSMSDFGAPDVLAGPLGLLFPLAELVCAAALIPVRSARLGAAGILTLLVLFIVVVSITLISGRKPDCHCFGKIHSAPIGWGLVLRNVILGSFTGLVVSEGAGKSVLHWSDDLSRIEVVALALAFGIVFLAVSGLWALIHLLKQNGRLLLRIEALESRNSAPVEVLPPGLPVGGEAPPFRLKNLQGTWVTLDTLGEQGKSILLLFNEAGCGPCDAILPEAAQWQSEYADRLVIVPIGRGDVQVNRARSEKHGLVNTLLQVDRETATAYLAQNTPSAVLVKDRKIASPVSIGADAIRSLVATANVPPSVKKGDSVPSLRLRDLKGENFDLATLRGRRVLILFWNPSCGFCQQMLDDVKAWERKPPKDAPELLIIAAGSAEENRKQEFRSRLLLDPYFSASQVFNSGGTPSAVLIDEQGRVASEVGVGAVEVMALAGVVVVGSS